MKSIFEFSKYYLDKLLLNNGIKNISDDQISLSLLKKEKLENIHDVNDRIYRAILSKEPFLVGRFGANELSMMKTIEFDIKSKYSICTEMMNSNAGFFPKDQNLIKGFLPLMLEFCKECDVLGTWEQPFEGYFIKKYMKKTVCLTKLENLEPWYWMEHPWSAALEGKTVLVIHPFIDTIQTQYKKRNQIFPNTKVLPEFELITIKAVQSFAGMKDTRFDNWYAALEWMFEETMNYDFDVAIIGCGAYGAPLAMKIKKAGKQAIHLGGATQLLFGIKGKRWDGSLNSKYNYIQSLFNEAWIYPLESDKIKNEKKIESGCYW